MLVDGHFHLEEGPYFADWLRRTALAIERAEADGFTQPSHSLAWMGELQEKLNRRLAQGSFSREWLGHYLRLGKAKGIRRFGIVDHLYRFEEFRAYYEKHMVMDDSEMGRMQRYWLDRVCIGSIEPFIRLIREAQQEGHPISLGVEADFFPGGEEELRGLLAGYELDFVIGSVHFYEGWGYDNPQLAGKFDEYDLPELYRGVFEYVKMAARSGIFDIIAHPDNLKVFGHRPDEAALLPMYEDVAATLREAGVATEINTGLAYRYPVKEMCPSPAFLQTFHRHGVPITLSSDSHFPDDIGTMLEDAKALAARTGYEEVVYFERRERKTITIKG